MLLKMYINMRDKHHMKLELTSLMTSGICLENKLKEKKIVRQDSWCDSSGGEAGIFFFFKLNPPPEFSSSTFMCVVCVWQMFRVLLKIKLLIE